MVSCSTPSLKHPFGFALIVPAVAETADRVFGRAGDTISVDATDRSSEDASGSGVVSDTSLEGYMDELSNGSRILYGVYR